MTAPIPVPSPVRPSRRLRAAAIVGGVFGGLGVVAGTGVLTGLAQPDYQVLPWLVRYNVGAGAVALIVAMGLWQAQQWASAAAVALTTAHAAVFVSLGVLRLAGVGVADDSLVAMGLRTLVWAAIAQTARAVTRPRRLRR